MTINGNYGSIPGVATNGSCEAEESTARATNNDEKFPLLQAALNEAGIAASSSRMKDPEFEKHNFHNHSIWSRLTFGWFTPLLDHGNHKKRLDQDDLSMIPFPEDCSTSRVTEIFEQYWQEELKRADDDNNHHPSLIRTLFRSFGAEFMQAGALKLLHDCCIFVGPQVLNAMIYFLRDANASYSHGLGLTALVTISQICMSLCLRHYFFKCYITGLRIRTAIVVAVYKKALRLSAGERQRRTSGEITNLMSVDAKRLQGLTTYLHAIWYSLFQICVSIFFLWRQLGPSCLGGISVMVLIMPLTKKISELFETIGEQLMKAKDARVNINSEVLSYMKIVKIQAWEEAFRIRILEFRNKELQVLKRFWILSGAADMIYGATPLAVALATFAAYVWTGHKLEVASALTALALFAILNFPVYMLPETINNIVSAIVSIKRVQSFLLCDEHHALDTGSLTDVGIAMTDVSAAYEAKSKESDDLLNPSTMNEVTASDCEPLLLPQTRHEASDQRDAERSTRNPLSLAESDSESGSGSKDKTDLLCLKSIDFQCKRGEIIAVCGSVGSGKTSFVNAILGEVKQLSGTTYVNGSLSYAAQTPFIFNGSVKENILFGQIDKAFDASKYMRALSACALDHDLKAFPAGDETEIGERGITLSGGQKARLNLARCCYKNADITLVDDALSAVDAHIAKHIFENCILGDLHGENRCVILVTNAVQFLNHDKVTRIVVLKDGRICEQGSFHDLRHKKGSQFSKFLAVGIHNHSSTSDAKASGTVAGEPTDPEDVSAILGNDISTEEHKKPSECAAMTGELMTEEKRAVGHVKLKVYFAWAKAAGGAWVPFLIAGLFAVVEAINVFLNWWLTYWSSHGDMASQYWFLTVYALVNLASVVVSFFAFLTTSLLGLQASRSLFEGLLASVMQAPMAFFDTTPTGRIVNRFSEDMYTIDEDLVSTLQMYLWTLMAVFGTVFVISGVTPIFTVCLVPIIALYAIEQTFFTVTYRELKRLDSVNESPIFALLGETIDGVTTIRAFSAEIALIRRLTLSLDAQQHAYYLTCSALCWLAVRLELLGTTIITFACLCAVAGHHRMNGNEISAGLFGLAISYALSVTQELNWSVRMASDFEAKMVSVERVKEYCNLQSEADRHTLADATAQQQNWPSNGKIEFRGAKLRYRPGLPLVLKGLDLIIPARSKVGVVGRTGAGKSTLMTSLLRIVELDEGSIFIDDVNIRTLGLETLRSKIAFIPQDPILFSGTIRSNLDPFDNVSDQMLEDVLVRVGLLKPENTSTTSAASSESSHEGHIQSLDDEVTQGASNFSVGQRQLLVIARALLSEASIVILDEATASIDPNTDAYIQKVLHTDFANATTLTVAHRLHTIKESDFILVMDDGQAAEFDSPQNLLSRQDGMFRKLLEAADAVTAKH